MILMVQDNKIKQETWFNTRKEIMQLLGDSEKC